MIIELEEAKMGSYLNERGRELRDTEIVRLRAKFNLTHKRIAQRLGAHISTVAKVLKRAELAAAARR